jgi:hypothetical protein
MRDLIVTVAGPSTSRAPRELEQLHGLNEVLDDENISEYSSDDDNVFDNDTQIMTPETHVSSDSESDNGSEERQKKNVNVGL